MFKPTKKNLSYLGILLASFLLISGISFCFKSPLADILKYPSVLANWFCRETGALIFFHHNMVENERLAKENGLLKNKLNQLREIYLENQRLKELFSFKQKAPFKVVSCRVIGHASDSWSSVVIVDKGQNSGIKKGMVAINHLGLVGRVMESTAFLSKVMLINDPNLSVSAISQRSRQEGLVTGTMGNSMIMKYLPLDANVKVSDIIETSGFTSNYPKGIIIGIVTEIGTEFSGLSSYALVRPAVDLSNLEELLIIVQ